MPFPIRGPIGFQGLVPSTWFNNIDEDHSRALDVVNGDTATPSNDITFNGPGSLIFNCPVAGNWTTPPGDPVAFGTNDSDPFEVGGWLSVPVDLFIGGASVTFTGNGIKMETGAVITWLNGSSAAFVNGSTLLQSAGATWTLNGSTTVNGTLAGSGAAVSGTFTYTSNPTFSGNYTRTGKETRSGAGGRTRKRSIDAPDANSDITVEMADIVKLPVNLGVSRTYTLTNAGTPQQGEPIRIRRTNHPNQPSGAGSASLQRSGGTQIFLFPVERNAWCDVEWNDATAQWEVIGFYAEPP